MVSSPKLAKILQKLLIIGRVMIMESNSSSHNSLLKSKLHPNKSNSSSSSSSNGKMTILEQLILISNMKGETTYHHSVIVRLLWLHRH